MPSKNKVVLSVKNVSKTFYAQGRHASIGRRIASMVFPKKHAQKIEALKDISFDVYDGDFLGIIGTNGSGKSTLLKIIMGSILSNEGGSITTDKRMIRLALGMGFDIALTARDNIYLNGTILGLTFKEIGDRFAEIIEYAELEDFIDTPLRFYSSGMRSRLAFAIALHAEADIFLIDEFFGGVGDESFKAKSDKVFNNRLITGKTILFVSHFMELIEKNCNRLLVIDKGIGYLFEDVLDGITFYKDRLGKEKKVVEYS